MDIKIEDVRLFIVANEVLSDNSSNGRTLLNIVRNVPPENKAQLFLRGVADKRICKNNYKVSDQDALSFFLGKKPNPQQTKTNVDASSIRTTKRNCKNLLLRNVVWKSYRWWKKDFDEFIDNFNPNVVLLQAGDSPFMFAIARKIAKKRNIPLIMYNSETYVLKKKLYSLLGISSYTC